MRDDVLAHLRCPSCGGTLGAAGPALRCLRGHSYDVAKQGYVNLRGSHRGHTGDTATMVAARASFLAAGHFRFVADELVNIAGAAPADGGLVVDAGGGTGYFLAAVLDAAPGATGVAVDASASAARRAARAHPRAASVVADVWHRLPLAERSAALLLNVFAPRNGTEFARVLRHDGVLLVVTPEPGHLSPLVSELGLLAVDPAKPERVATSLGGLFRVSEQRGVERLLR